MSDTATAAAAPVEKVKLTILGVIKDLDEGLDRKQIAKKYGLNKANATALFKNEKLQHRKVTRPLVEQFELVDDAPDLKPIVVKPRTAKAEGTEATKETETATTASTTASIPPAPPVDAAADVKGSW